MRFQDREGAFPRERRGAGQQVVECTTETVDVGADVGVRRVGRLLLSGHKGGRSQHCPRRRQIVNRLLAADGLGQAEVENLDDVPLAAVRQDQVVRLNVAVDHAVL